MINKKKKGSSLLVTVAMFAILSILVMSVLAMTTSGYSLRIKSNKRIENFYAADSGLEIGQKVIHDHVGKVVKASMQRVDDYIASQGSANVSQEQREKKFKEAFKDIVLNGGALNDDSGNFIETLKALKEEVELPSHYSSFQRDGKAVIIESKISSIDKHGTIVTVPLAPYESIDKFLLNIKSNFTDRDNKEREVEVDFEIFIPQYGELLIRSKNSSVPNILNYIVGLDGDYIISTDTTTSVLGDMWVKGKTPLNSSINVNNKYEGGITVRQPEGSAYGAPEVSWDGTIATNGTLNVENVTLKNGVSGTSGEEHIFARNVRVKNTKNKATGENKELFGNATNMYVYNDFLLEGIQNNILLKSYYGLNDINDYEKNWESKNLKNAQKSSSMIINSSDFGNGSSIKILQDLFVLGTSYLDLKGNDYQTGQSTIMNNISRPYTMRYDNYLYQYKSYMDGGIHIATKDKDGKELSLSGSQGKLDLAKKFYETNSDYFKNGLAVSQEAKIASTGVILANNKAILKTPTNEQLNEAKKKQNRFVQEVFYMGSKDNYDQKEFWNGKVRETVQESFNWDGINDIAKTDYNADPTSPLVDNGGNNINFIHLTTKKTLGEIMDQGKADNHELGKYGNSWSGKTYVPNIILSNSDKELVIRNSGVGTSKLVDETDKRIIYDVAIGNANDSPPLLVIAKGKIIFEPFNGYNHIMLISADSAEIKIPYGTPSIVGNYDAGTPEGNRKLINELFKYILANDSIIGSVGGSIILGNEEKVTTNAIEISELIKSKHWKLNK